MNPADGSKSEVQTMSAKVNESDMQLPEYRRRTRSMIKVRNWGS